MSAINERVSDERLNIIKSWRKTYGQDANVMIPASEAESIISELQQYRAAAEPVAWQWFHLNQWHVTNDEERARELAWDGVKVVPLYRHAVPQVTSVPDLKCDDDGNTTSEFDHGWNACRAAALAAPSVQEGPDYRDIVERVARVLHGSVTDISLLPVTAQSVINRLVPPPVSDAEPVAWLWSHRKHQSEVTLVRPEYDKRSEAAHWSGWICQPLYATPQAVEEQKEKK